MILARQSLLWCSTLNDATLLACTGTDCTGTDLHPCNMPATPEYPYGTSIQSVCAGECNTRTGQCLCGARSPYPMRSALAPCGFERIK